MSDSTSASLVDAGKPETEAKDGGLEFPDSMETPRLLLKRMNNPEDAAQREWFHRIWTDDACTMWSPTGKTKSVEDSHERMKRFSKEFKSITYAVFAKPSSETNLDAPPKEEHDPGLLLGHCGFFQAGPSLPPYPRAPEPAPQAAAPSEHKLNVKSLGYSYFRYAWGKGYATEAGRAIVNAYDVAVQEYKRKRGAEVEDEDFWIEGGWDKDNPASGRVLTKLGFKEVGWHVDSDEKMFLGGAWRDPGYWVWGRWMG